MAVADAVCRMVPGVLPEPACYEEESHWNGLLEYPQYSRPAFGTAGRCRRCSAPGTTRRSAAGGSSSHPPPLQRRPDIFREENFQGTKQDRKLLAEALAEFEAERERPPEEHRKANEQKKGRRPRTPALSCKQGLSPVLPGQDQVEEDGSSVAMTTGDLPKTMVTASGNWLREALAWEMPTPRAAERPTMVVFRAFKSWEAMSFMPVMAMVENTVTVAPPSTHWGMVVRTAANLGETPASSRKTPVRRTRCG